MAEWNDIPLAPLTGKLDTRSRPADLAAGEFRYKLNLRIDKTGKMRRRDGYSGLAFGQRSDDPEGHNNWDWHARDPKEMINLIFESTSSDGLHALFAGTQSMVAVMSNVSSLWSVIISGKGADRTIWKAAEVSDVVYFTNDHDEPLAHELNSGTATTIPDLQATGLTKAKLVFQFGGVIVWMNTYEDGVRFGSRIRWSNHLDGMAYDPGADDVAGFQDLDYGDDILNAVEVAGALWVFTARSIWRMVVNVTEDTIFGFQRLYADPKERTGCLVYPNTLVSDGRNAYWFSKESIYTMNPFLGQPKATDDHDWLMKASGEVFEGPDRIDSTCCNAAIGYYSSEHKEVFFFYPRLTRPDFLNCINDWGLVINTQFSTADHVDFGMTAMASFRFAPVAQLCTSGAIVGASGLDFTLKNIGGTFTRDEYPIDSPTDLIPLAGFSIEQTGYFSLLRGICPLGFPEDEKIIKGLALDHDTADAISEEPNVAKLRIGNSFALRDPNATEARCSPLWHDIRLIDPDGEPFDMPLQCPDEQDIADMAEENLRPSESDSTGWEMWEEGRYLYFELKITAFDGEPPLGSDTAWSRLVFTAMTKEP